LAWGLSTIARSSASVLARTSGVIGQPLQKARHANLISLQFTVGGSFRAASNV